MRSPLETINAGGGVWRIRQPQETTSEASHNLLGLACMHNGFHIVDKHSVTIMASFKEHESLAYGLDFKSLQDEEKPVYVMASCSFYDHTLKVWNFKLS